MAWAGSERASQLPSNWKAIREKVFKRDGYRCKWKNVYGERCPSDAEECDHIGSNSDHSMENLRALCHYHHSLHTAEQSAVSRARKRARVRNKFRRAETHPGLIGP